MSFNGFTTADFETFQIDGLHARMHAIREHIQPKFQTIGEMLIRDFETLAGNEMYIHIAKHARRTKNPPDDTWVAFCHDKRGYKKHPHFQVGLFDDRLFIWLAFIYEVANKSEIGQTLQANADTISARLAPDFVVAQDHTKKYADPLSDIDLTTVLDRFQRVKKAELLFGKHIMKEDPLLQDGHALKETFRTTFETLFPIYQLALRGMQYE